MYTSLHRVHCPVYVCFPNYLYIFQSTPSRYHCTRKYLEYTVKKSWQNTAVYTGIWRVHCTILSDEKGLWQQNNLAAGSFLWIDVCDFTFVTGTRNISERNNQSLKSVNLKCIWNEIFDNNFIGPFESAFKDKTIAVYRLLISGLDPELWRSEVVKIVNFRVKKWQEIGHKINKNWSNLWRHNVYMSNRWLFKWL